MEVFGVFCLEKSHFLCCETQVTIISTITSNNNNSGFHETFHLDGAQSLGGSTGCCIQLTLVLQTVYKPLELLGEQKTSIHRVSAESITGLLADNAGFSPKKQFLQQEEAFFFFFLLSL